MYCGKWRNILRITHLWNLWSGVVSGILSSGLFTGCSLNLGSTNHRKLWKLTSNWSAHGSGRVSGYRGESGSGRRAVGEKLYLILIKLDIGWVTLLIHWMISRLMVFYVVSFKSLLDNDLMLYKESPWGAASGMSRCHFFGWLLMSLLISCANGLRF